MSAKWKTETQRYYYASVLCWFTSQAICQHTILSGRRARHRVFLLPLAILVEPYFSHGSPVDYNIYECSDVETHTGERIIQYILYTARTVILFTDDFGRVRTRLRPYRIVALQCLLTSKTVMLLRTAYRYRVFLYDTRTF